MNLKERLRLEEIEGQTLLGKKAFPANVDKKEDEMKEPEPKELTED